MNLKDDAKAYAIMGCAMHVHKVLGDGFIEYDTFDKDSLSKIFKGTSECRPEGAKQAGAVAEAPLSAVGVNQNETVFTLKTSMSHK